MRADHALWGSLSPNIRLWRGELVFGLRQIIELLLQLTFYAGGPAARTAIASLKDLLKE